MSYKWKEEYHLRSGQVAMQLQIDVLDASYTGPVKLDAAAAACIGSTSRSQNIHNDCYSCSWIIFHFSPVTLSFSAVELQLSMSKSVPAHEHSVAATPKCL